MIAAPSARRAVARWLFLVAALIFLMTVIGGITRLTESGLSIVDWRPVTGALPPIGEAAWMAEFDKYRQSPQYQLVNRGMTLDQFQQIFWWEYIHRLWGRLIGLAYAVPFAWFLWRGAIPRPYRPHLWAALALGGLQGAVGWAMVASGLVDRPSVSQYRLVAHLGLALVIYVYLLWLGLSLWRGDRPAADRPGRRSAPALAVLAFLTILSGGFVAGLDAGMTYNTFPLMEGRWVPELYGSMTPWWVDPFENAAAVQFHHRVLASLTAAAVLAMAVRLAWTAPPSVGRLALACGAMVAVQFALGVATLLLHVPVALGAAHQAGAVTLLTLLVCLAHAVRRTGEPAAGKARI
ncbi:cytochrome c oxidase assembly protein subunit 15 [Stella humosa]|uniref:Heme A synthase n=1 Tax=Stella humosa TaxID=94 RepID=A0A3N1KJS3_9PROT|nr:COX15/CtaA family protein [Stella humosa]ROP81081.1 cytochrome c oxidase assembly protein subunit 15 [Stella humosa]